MSVYEDAGVARDGAPVRIGVPLPASAAIRDANELHLRAADGAEVPVQARVLTRWDAPPADASAPARWVLLDFDASVAANGHADFTVVRGPAVASSAGLASGSGGEIAIDTGAFRARFTKSDPGPLALSAAGVAAHASEVILEENGPIAATVLVRGELEKGFTEVGGHLPLRWEMRWHFAKGEPGGDAEVTIENPDRPYEKPYNDVGAPRGKKLKNLLLTVSPSLRAGDLRSVSPSLREGAGGGGLRDTVTLQGKHFPTPVTLLAPDESFVVSGGKKLLLKGTRASGWITRGQVSLGMRDFWESYPKALAADRTLSLDLFPVETFFQGARAKTQEMWLRTAGDARAADSPLRAAIDPAWLRDSGALGAMSIADAARWPALEETTGAIVHGKPGSTLDAEREAEHAYGWLDYGDTFRAADPSHRRFGNNEFDFGWVLYRQYLRDPRHDAAFLQAAHAALFHLMDVDVMHTDDDAFWANHGVRKHDLGELAEHSHGPDFSHFWVRGLLAWYVTTGDERAREVAVGEIGRWIRNREDPKRPGWLTWADELRDVGWVLVALDDLYQVTGDPEDLALAQRVVKTMVLPSIGPDGAMRDAVFLENKDFFPPWQEAYIADGLGRLALSERRRGTPDAEMEGALRKTLAFLADKSWIREPRTIYGRTYPETLAFEIKRDGSMDASEASMTQAVEDPMIWGWLLFKDERWRAIARKAAGEVFPAGPEVPYYDRSIATPAKGAAIKLYFGDAERWDEQTGALRAGAD